MSASSILRNSVRWSNATFFKGSKSYAARPGEGLSAGGTGGRQFFNEIP
jgi:hypothetical protein